MSISPPLFDYNLSEKDLARFWSKVDRRSSHDCWEWAAGRDRDGYGMFRLPHNTPRAHRVSYLMAYGPFPQTLLVCHSCDNPACVNPQHLFLATNQVNLADRNNKNRQAKGESIGSSTLTSLEVLEIRRLYATGQYTQADLAAQFGVSAPSVISQIASGKVWKHIGGPLRSPGRGRRGEAHHGAMLTADNVREIRQLYETGDFSQPSLARQFGVSLTTINRVICRRLWKHVD